MVTPVSVEKLEVKSHGTPDELRTPKKTRVEVVKLQGYTIGGLTSNPDGVGQNASSPW